MVLAELDHKVGHARCKFITGVCVRVTVHGRCAVELWHLIQQLVYEVKIVAFAQIEQASACIQNRIAHT